MTETQQLIKSLKNLKYTDIIKLCQSNKTINNFCKKNPQRIAKYVLKNDYGFIHFPNNIDYINLVKYFQIIEFKPCNQTTTSPQSNNKIIYKNLSDKEKNCVQNKVDTVMKEFKTEQLHSSSGQLVKNPKQAIAIALSVAKKKCSIK